MPTNDKQQPGMSFYSVRPELEQYAQQEFAFLTKDKGFTAAAPDRSVFATMFYFLASYAELGIEVQVDFRDTAVSVYLIRLKDEAMPKHGFVQYGERVRIDLLQLLLDVLHVNDEHLVATREFLWYTRPRDLHFGQKAINRWRECVSQYIDTMLAQPISSLFPPAPPNTSAASQALR